MKERKDVKKTYREVKEKEKDGGKRKRNVKTEARE